MIHVSLQMERRIADMGLYTHKISLYILSVSLNDHVPDTEVFTFSQGEFVLFPPFRILPCVMLQGIFQRTEKTIAPALEVMVMIAPLLLPPRADQITSIVCRCRTI